MYVESWVAIAAVLLWAAVDDPLLKSAAVQGATIAAVTTLLFNLNPFGRMDGYYVLADLAESPNLMQRASAAAVALAARLARVRPAAELPPLEPLLLAYWVGVLAYRLVVFAGLVWLAHALSPWVALVMLAVAVSLLLVRPAIATARRLVAMAAEPARVRWRLALSAGLLCALFLLVPVPAGLRAVGVVEAEGARFLYPPRDVRVVAVEAGGGSGDAPRLQLESPELADAQRQAAIRGAEAMARWRQVLDRGGDGAQAAAEAVAGQQLAAEALAAEEARLTIAAMPGWDPLRAAEYAGSWVSPNPRAPLAVAIPGDAWRIRAVVPEADADRLRGAESIAEARIAGRPDIRMQARVDQISDTAVETLPSEALGRPAGGPITVDPADPLGRRATAPVVEVWLSVAPGPVALRHGQRVELRFGTAARPLGWQGVEAALRLLDPGAGA
jgi:putative peptide zinc metalloprotease protein